MIDLNAIRSVARLEEIKADLVEFINHPQMKEVYLTQYEWSEDDYTADIEASSELLERVERRLKSLKDFEAKKDSPRCKKSETKASPLVE